jgi:hypothetical protein
VVGLVALPLVEESPPHRGSQHPSALSPPEVEPIG